MGTSCLLLAGCSINSCISCSCSFEITVLPVAWDGCQYFIVALLVPFILLYLRKTFKSYIL